MISDQEKIEIQNVVQQIAQCIQNSGTTTLEDSEE